MPRTFLALTFVVTGCGLTQPYFEDYETTMQSTGPASANTECGAAALKAFSDNVEPAIETTCGREGCHASSSDGFKKRPMLPSQDDKNRASLYAYTGTDKDKLTAKIGGGNHGGGDVSADMPKDKIVAWLEAEGKCVN